MSEEAPKTPAAPEQASESPAPAKPATDVRSLAREKNPSNKTNCPVPRSQPEPVFDSLGEALSDRLFQLDKRLRLNEDLMMTYIFREEINESYYRLWRDDANRLFRCACAARNRLLKSQKTKAS